MIVAGVLGTAIVGAGAMTLSASAATNASSREDSLASKIASKFNINKDEVKKVLDEDHQARQAERQADMTKKLEDRLTQAVKDGKLTEAQKTKILDYMKTQQSFMDSLKDKTEEERKTAMDQKRQEIQKWAKDNGIDEKYVMPFGGHGGHKGGGRMMDRDGDDNSGQKSSSSSSSSSTTN